MNKLLSSIVITTSALMSASAFADNIYLGVSLGTPGEASINFGTGKLVDNYDNPITKKLYGGLVVSDHFGLEGDTYNGAISFAILLSASTRKPDSIKTLSMLPAKRALH